MVWVLKTKEMLDNYLISLGCSIKKETIKCTKNK